MEINIGNSEAKEKIFSVCTKLRNPIKQQLQSTIRKLIILSNNWLCFLFLDVTTPEEQEQVFAASIHNLTKIAAIFLKECTVKWDVTEEQF